MRGAKVAKTDNARRLRRNATIAEHRLWYRLRSRSLYGMKFVRQEPIGPYIVDFVCRERRLIIEVDGGQHSENVCDVIRDRWLVDHDYRVLRFWNNDVIRNIDGVLGTIASALPHDGPAPFPRLPLGRLRPSSTGYGEGRGEGASPQAQTRQAQTRGTPPSSRPSPPPKSGLPDFGTLRVIEIGSSRFRLGGEGERCGKW
jgi:very-short-patch-repair endonuclease